MRKYHLTPRAGSLCLALLGFVLPSAAQSGNENQWTWMAGSNSIGANCSNTFCGQLGVYGTLGIPAAANVPGSRGNSASWTDSRGNLWLFGGDGFAAAGSDFLLNDLWEFNASTREWTWRGGSSATNQYGVYGTLETPAKANIPGARSNCVSWTDSSGNFWLFGGWGFDARGGYGALGDLWKFNPATGEWTWMGGSDTFNQPSVFGTLGTAAAGNFPGGRYFAMGWTDRNGKFWLFGGYGYDSNNAFGEPDDLWMFDPSNDQWAWMGGSNKLGSSCPTAFCGTAGIYGTLHTPAAGNMPGSRSLAVTWTDSAGNLWLFSGVGFDANGTFNNLNDLWEFNVSSKQWAWMGGSATGGQPGIYGTLRMASAANIPGSRNSASIWIDSKDRAWIFGGQSEDASGYIGELNDLWKLDPSNIWAWMGGANLAGNNSSLGHVGPPGVYGTPGSAAAANVPGGRTNAVTWRDPNDRLWVFGGYGFDSIGAWGYLNDLWVYQTPIAAAATPAFSLRSGSFTSAQTVTLSDGTPGSTIYYTADGTTPTTASPIYTDPISVLSTETLQAIATASGYSPSAVATATYIINLPSADFSFTASPTSLTVTGGQSGTTSIMITPQNGFKSAVSFACSGLPSGDSCSFSPANVTPNGTAASTTLTVSTAKLSASLGDGGGRLLLGISMAALACGWRTRRRWPLILLLVLSGMGVGLLNGCGGGSSPGGGGNPRPVTSTVTITATSGSLRHTATFTLTVN